MPQELSFQRENLRKVEYTTMNISLPIEDKLILKLTCRIWNSNKNLTLGLLSSQTHSYLNSSSSQRRRSRLKKLSGHVNINFFYLTLIELENIVQSFVTMNFIQFYILEMTYWGSLLGYGLCTSKLKRVRSKNLQKCNSNVNIDKKQPLHWKVNSKNPRMQWAYNTRA